LAGDLAAKGMLEVEARNGNTWAQQYLAQLTANPPKPPAATTTPTPTTPKATTPAATTTPTTTTPKATTTTAGLSDSNIQALSLRALAGDTAAKTMLGIYANQGNALAKTAMAEVNKQQQGANQRGKTTDPTAQKQPEKGPSWRGFGKSAAQIKADAATKENRRLDREEAAQAKASRETQERNAFFNTGSAGQAASTSAPTSTPEPFRPPKINPFESKAAYADRVASAREAHAENERHKANGNVGLSALNALDRALGKAFPKNKPADPASQLKNNSDPKQVNANREKAKAAGIYIEGMTDEQVREALHENALKNLQAGKRKILYLGPEIGFRLPKKPKTTT
jgi:hypothetical protein